MARFNEGCCRFRCVRLHKQFQSFEKTKLQGIFASKHKKVSSCTPWGFYCNHYPDTIVFSVRKQLFLQNQSHLPLWNSAKSSKSDSNTLLSPSSSIPLGICLAVTIAGGGKHGNALIVNRLFFTTWEKQHFSTIAQLGRPSCTLVKFTGGTARFSIIIIIYLLAKCYQLRAEPQHISCSYNAGRNLSWAFQSRGQTRDSYCDKNSVFTKCSLPSAKT